MSRYFNGIAMVSIRYRALLFPRILLFGGGTRGAKRVAEPWKGEGKGGLGIYKGRFVRGK